MKKKLLVFLLFMCSFSMIGQQYPVQLLINIQAPAPVNLYNYADDTSLNSPITVQIFLNDLTISNRQIKLKTYFEGGSIQFQSKDFVLGAENLFIDGGIPLMLRNTELAPYYKYENIQGIGSATYGQSIPEGSYDFCFEVFDYLTGSKLSAKKCAKVFIFKNEPPLLNLPFNGTNIEPKDFENIVFQWTPRHLNVSNVEYELSIVEIWDNNVSPQTAFLSQIPIYQETTRATSLLYGADKPQLLPDKRYAWRVQAKALQGLEEIGLFKNEGYSEVFWFSRTSPCQAPEGISAEPKGLTKINVYWNEDPIEYSDYIIAYREANKPDAYWFTKKTNSAWATIWNLKPGTTYEYKVKGKCTYQYSEYSEVQYVTTDIVTNEDANYQCGIVPDEIAITNREPHPGLIAGSQITAGDFKVVITEITSQSPGAVSGKGYVSIPYLNFVKFAVDFNSILVNTDNQLAQGEIVTVYDAKFGEGASMTVDVNVNISEGINGDAGDTKVEEVDFVIDSVTINADGAIIVTGINADGEPDSAIIPGDKDVKIISSNGDVWSVGEDGTVTTTKGAEGGAVIAESTNGIDADGQVTQITAKGVLVKFEKSGYYSYDALPQNTSPELAAEYKSIDAPGEKYEIPYKALSDNNGEDFIYADVQITDNAIVKDSIVFKTKEGAKVDILSWNGNKAKLKLARKFHYADEDIYATIKNKEGKYDIAGALITTHLASEELETINVVLVPVGAKITDGLIAKTKEIYAKAGVRLNIEIKEEVDLAEISDWDLDKNNRLEVGDSSILSHYTNEEKAFNTYVKNQTYYNKKTYYVFITNVSVSKDIDGFMPLKRQFGFVFTAKANTIDKQTKTLAHELGHGIFGLEHTWDEYKLSKGATDFLMDNGSGTVLNHLDWKKMHAPGMQLYWFQGDEDGESATVTNIEGLKDLKNQDGTYTFISRAGKPITLPSDITSVTFSTGDSSTCDSDIKNPFRILPFGTLSSFTLSETNYVARWSCAANKFSGYAITNTTDYYLDKNTNTSITSAIVGFPAVSSGEIVFKVGKISITPEKGGEDYKASGDYEEFDFLANKISEITKYNEIYAKFDPNYDTEVKQFILDHADQNTSESGFYGNNAYLFIHATQLQKHDILKGCFKKGIPGRMLKFIMENKEVFIPSEFGGEWYSYEAPVFSDTYEPETDNDLKLIKYWKDFDLNFYPIIEKAVKAFKIPENLTSQGIVDLFKDQEHINSPATNNWDCFWSNITIEDKKYFIKTFADDGFLFKGYYDLDSDSEHILLKIFTTTTSDSERDQLLTYIKTHKYIDYIFSSLDYNSSHSAYFMREIYTWLKTKNGTAYDTQSVIAKNLEFDNWIPTVKYKLSPDDYSTDKFVLYGENWYDSNSAIAAAFNADLIEASPPGVGNSTAVNSTIKISQKIREDNSWTHLFEARLIGEFDLYAPVYVKFKSDHFKKYNPKLVEGTSVILPAIYLHWLDKSLERKNNETALRIFADVVAIALAPVTAGGSTLILTVEITAASIDIVFAVFEDEIAEQLGEESIQTWNAIYGIYNLIYLPQMVKGVYQGGRSLFNITTDFVGNAYRIKKINVDYTKLDDFVEIIKSLSREDKLKAIAHITETIKQFKRAGGKYFNRHVYNVMLEARFKILMSIDDTSAVLKLDQSNFVVSKGGISMSVGKVDFINDIPTITESTRWLPDNRAVNNIAELKEVGFIENGVSKTGIVKILEDVSNPGQFYIKSFNGSQSFITTLESLYPNLHTSYSALNSANKSFFEMDFHLARGDILEELNQISKYNQFDKLKEAWLTNRNAESFTSMLSKNVDEFKAWWYPKVNLSSATKDLLSSSQKAFEETINTSITNYQNLPSYVRGEFWNYYKQRKWAKLEALAIKHKINKTPDGTIWPPANGGYNVIPPYNPPVNMKLDRYGAVSSIDNGIPELRGSYVSPLDGSKPYTFEQRSLNQAEHLYDVYYEITILKDFPFKIETADVIPWGGYGGNGKQSRLIVTENAANGFPKTLTQLAQEGKIKITIKSSPNGNYNSLVNTTIKNANWVEVTDVATKVANKTPHVLRIDMTPNNTGFKGCHSKIALDEYIANNPTANYELRNKIMDASDNGVYEARPVLKLANGSELEKINNSGKSSFFPDNWNEVKILEEVQYAIENNHGVFPGGSPNEYFGFSRDGSVEIHFYLGRTGFVNSYFPKKY